MMAPHADPEVAPHAADARSFLLILTKAADRGKRFFAIHATVFVLPEGRFLLILLP